MKNMILHSIFENILAKKIQGELFLQEQFLSKAGKA